MTITDKLQSSPPSRDYAAIYRSIHPINPFHVWTRPRELSDLWPVEQARFRRTVDAILKARSPND